MVREVIMPKLGQTMDEGTIVEWLKQEGEPVQRGDILFSTESDKATLEVESPAKGFLRRILVPAGQTVPVLTVVALMTRTVDEDLSTYGGSAEEAGTVASAQELTGVGLGGAGPTVPVREAKKPEGGRIFASPRARRLAREKGAELTLVIGTGPNGRIVERDVMAYLEALSKATPVARRLAEGAGINLRGLQGTGPGGRITKGDVEQAIAETAPPPAIPRPAAVAEPIASVPMSGARAVIAQRMHGSHQATAPVTLTMEVDATDFVTLREQLKSSLADELGFNIGYNDLLIKLTAHALRKFPYMNVRLDEADRGAGVIRQLNEVHVALAVDAEHGLLVPVIRDADRKGLTDVARETRDLVERARSGRALPDELSGSTFTITNMGMLEVDAFTPLINLPEAAILGVGRIKDRPAVVDGGLCVRKTTWLSLTFDHRLVDGAPAARFLQYLKDLIERPMLWLGARM